jgi:hypothetical protein
MRRNWDGNAARHFLWIRPTTHGGYGWLKASVGTLKEGEINFNVMKNRARVAYPESNGSPSGPFTVLQTVSSTSLAQFISSCKRGFLKMLCNASVLLIIHSAGGRARRVRQRRIRGLALDSRLAQPLGEIPPGAESRCFRWLPEGGTRRVGGRVCSEKDRAS